MSGRILIIAHSTSKRVVVFSHLFSPKMFGAIDCTILVYNLPCDFISWTLSSSHWEKEKKKKKEKKSKSKEMRNQQRKIKYRIMWICVCWLIVWCCLIVFFCYLFERLFHRVSTCVEFVFSMQRMCRRWVRIHVRREEAQRVREVSHSQFL